MKKLLLILFLPLLLTIAGCSDEDRSFSIDDVTIDAQIDEAGIMHVRELYTYTFDGSFEGMTRSIGSDVHQFQAYLATNADDPTISTERLEGLKTEKGENDDEDMLKIYSKSKNETKRVLYSYEVHGSVKKYADVADVTYAFFDESNETDLNNVEITLHSPANTISEDTYAFLHENGSGKLSQSGNGIQYTNPLLAEGRNSTIRFVFPAEELTKTEISKDKPMKANILAAEEDYANRLAHLEENMDKVAPVIWLLLGAVIALSIFLLATHPNRYRGDKGQDGLLRLMEETDPLYVKYIHDSDIYFTGHLTNESFIAALFSLKRRGIVTIQEVPSDIEREEKTFRFTWNQEHPIVDEADTYLHAWLFTEKDEYGSYFLLESLVVQEDETESDKKEKAKKFEKGFETWSEMMKARDDFQDLRKPSRRFPFVSVLLTIVSFGLFYYFTTIDTISMTLQWVFPSVLGILGLLSLLFNRKKWVLSIYYAFAIVATFWFTLTSTVILAVVFYAIALFALLIIPAHYWKKDIKRLKYAVHTAQHLFKKERYPIGSDPDKIEKRLEYAIVLGVGDAYGERCGKEEFVSRMEADYPLLSNPVLATDSFSSTNLILYSSIMGSSSGSSSSPSATGGGGAGAF